MNTRVLVAAVAAMATTSFAAELQEVASFPNQQVTGVGLRHPEKLSRIWIFHGGARRKSADIDVISLR